MDFLIMMWACARAYLACKYGNGTHYVGVTRNGVPQYCVFMGMGREAWRISQRAIEEIQLKR